MAKRLEIQCIVKDDRKSRHERIQFVGGVHGRKPWKLSEDDAIAAIGNGSREFWTKGGGVTANVIVGEHLGRPYLKTRADTTEKDNLLHLRPCPK